jgi:hypothetical protein
VLFTRFMSENKGEIIDVHRSGRTIKATGCAVKFPALRTFPEKCFFAIAIEVNLAPGAIS